MNLQKKTLQRYRQFFPGETLKETSTRTGIQITRVFRLFGGKTMKVKELEAFEDAVSAKLLESPNYNLLTRSLEEASALMTNEELGKITAYIQRKVAVRNFSRNYIRQNLSDANIA